VYQNKTNIKDFPTESLSQINNKEQTSILRSFCLKLDFSKKLRENSITSWMTPKTIGSSWSTKIHQKKKNSKENDSRSSLFRWKITSNSSRIATKKADAKAQKVEDELEMDS